MNLHSPHAASSGNATPADSFSNRHDPQGRLDWYIQRLRAMSAGEIVHRLQELAKRKISARRVFDWSDFDCGDGSIPSLPIPDHFEACPEVLLSQWREVSELARGSKLPMLGQTWPERRSPADWHRDPITGGTWPADVYCFNVPFRHMRNLGDPKLMWERNRLQYLQPIAALARKTGDGDLVRFCLEEIESWMEGNRPFNGLAWAAGIEVALRIVTLLTVASFLDSKIVTVTARRRLRACLAAHGYWLARFPSRHSSANNHLIAEAAGLYLLGTLAPDLKHAGEWAREGRRILCEQVDKQILDDGVGAEQSPSYTAFTLEWYLLCDWVAERKGAPLPGAVRDRLALAGRHLLWMLDENGNHPRIGDDDEGRVFYSQPQHEDRYVASIAGSIAARLKRPNQAPAVSDPHLRNFYFGFPRQGTQPKGQKSFDAGGYTVIREKIAGRDALLVLDHGPLGYLSIAAHGHADALAVWLHVDGKSVLADAGTCLYNSGRDWRDHFRGTAAHNTLTINGRSQSRMSGAFNWSQKAKAWRACDTEATVAAAHDGYSKAFGVIHRRELTLDTEQGFILRDSLEGTSREALEVEIGFLVHPELDAAIVEGGITISRGKAPILHVTGPRDLEVRLDRGEEAPRSGWYSPRYGVKTPATRVVFSGRCNAPCDFGISLNFSKPS